MCGFIDGTGARRRATPEDSKTTPADGPGCRVNCARGVV
jgi:hypothetical protein